MRIVLCRGGRPGRAVEQDRRWRCVRKLSTAIWRISNGWSAVITTPARFSAPGGDGAHYRLHSAPGALREMAKLARQLGIRLHSHLSETVDYLDAARQKFAMTPVQFCAEHDWLEMTCGLPIW